MRNRYLFHHDFLLEEEVGISLYTDMMTNLEGDVSLVDVREKKVEKTFSAFLDGTMRLYRVGFAYFTGTPLYISPISVALMVRDEFGRLRKSDFSVSFTIVLFPFDAYISFIKEKFREDLSSFFADFKMNLERRLLSFGIKLIDGANLEGEHNFDLRRKVFSEGNCWIISDTSRVGIFTKGRAIIQGEVLFDAGKVREIARRRARYFMGLAEFYSGFRYLQDRPGSYLMIDGALYPYRRVGRFFGIGRDEYRKTMGKVVGFIKHPQKVPRDGMIEFLASHSSGKVLVWRGYYSDEEEGEEQEFKDRELFDFVLFQFRPYSSFLTPANFVKLQFSDLCVEEVVNMVWHERNPLPTDRKRLFIEPYPIQVAENVAKASLHSEDMIRGFVLSLVPPVLA